MARRACRFGNDPVHGGAASPDEWAAIEKKRKEQLKKLNEEQPMLSAAERQSSFREVVAGFKMADGIFAGLGQQFQLKVLQSEAVQVPRACMDAACICPLALLRLNTGTQLSQL